MKDRKEIEIPSFMNQGETSHLTNMEKRIAEKIELDKRLANASYPEKREILQENKYNDRKNRMKEMKRKKQKQILGRKIAVYATYAAVIAGSVTLYKHQVNEIKKPINIVVHDTLANVNLVETDDARKVSALQFGKNKTDELYRYIKENEIAENDIYASVASYCKKNGIDYHFALVKLNGKYPELFENSLNIENGKSK